MTGEVPSTLLSGETSPERRPVCLEGLFQNQATKTEPREDGGLYRQKLCSPIPWASAPSMNML